MLTGSHELINFNQVVEQEKAENEVSKTLYCLTNFP